MTRLPFPWIAKLVVVGGCEHLSLNLHNWAPARCQSLCATPSWRGPRRSKTPARWLWSHPQETQEDARSVKDGPSGTKITPRWPKWLPRPPKMPPEPPKTPPKVHFGRLHGDKLAAKSYFKLVCGKNGLKAQNYYFVVPELLFTCFNSGKI